MTCIVTFDVYTLYTFFLKSLADIFIYTSMPYSVPGMDQPNIHLLALLSSISY